MIDSPKPSFLSRQSTAKVGLLALVLIALSTAIAVYPTLRFGRAISIEALQPIASFESGETFEFSDDDPYSEYLLSMTVTERDTPIPPMEITITNTQGEVAGTSMNLWNSVMGREYKQFLRLPAQPDGMLTLRIETPENEDFLIFRRFGDAFQEAKSRALPLWILALLPLLIAFGCFGIMLVRAVNSSSKIEMHVSS